MSEAWKRKSLGEVCEILDNRRKPITKRNRVAGTYPYYGATGVLDYVDGYIFDERLVLIGEDGAKWGAGDNTAYAVEGKCWVNNHAHVIRPNRNVMLDSWVIYYLNTTDLAPFISGLTVPKLNQGRLREIPIPLPPLSEQKRIVAILDEAFEGIDTVVTNVEKNLSNVGELFDGYLASVFSQRGDGWVDQPLKDVCVDYGRGKSKHRPRNDPRLYGGDYPFIQTGDVRKSDHIIKEYSTTYNQAGLSQSKLWPEGTICITIAANIAETGILGFDACFPDSIIGLVVDEKKASKEYVEYLLQSVKTVLKAKGKGSAQDNINLGTFEKEKFPFPPLVKQVEIAANLHELSSAVSSIEAIYQQKLTALAELKQSLLQKAFSGELTAERAEAAVEEVTV